MGATGLKETNTNPAGSSIESEDGLPEEQKLTLWQKLKGPFRFKVNLRNDKEQAELSDDTASPGDTQETGGEEAAPAKEKKRKPEKPAKPKKVKKPKAAKPKKKKTANSDKEKGKKGLIAIISISTVLLAGAVVAGIMIFRSMGSIDSQFQKAEKYMASEKYDDAIAVYNKLTAEGSDGEVTRAYLGLADAYVQKEDVESAVANLQVGYGLTKDEQLSNKIQELAPEASDPLSAAPPGDRVIDFSDPQFDKMVRMALNIPVSQTILQKDLDKVRSLKIIGSTHAVANSPLPVINTSDGYSINGELFTERGGITSLDDLRYFSNLTKLTIGYNSISDVSGLSDAGSLEMLGLYANNVGDLSVVADLHELKWLYVYHNNISDLSPLSGLSGLRHLYVQYNQITDLTPLSGLNSLEELFVDNNRISDISAVAQLKKLRFFSAKNNQISDISPIAGLQSLSDVSFLGNPVSDYAPAASVNNVNNSFGRVM